WCRSRAPGCRRSRSSSAHLLGRGLVGLGRAADAELALVHLGVDARDVLADRTQSTVALQLAGGRLESQVERLLLGRREGVRECAGLQAAQLLRGQVLASDRHQMSPPSRAMKR